MSDFTSIPSLFTATELLLLNANPLPCFLVKKETLKICAANNAASQRFGQTHFNDVTFTSLFTPESSKTIEHQIALPENKTGWNLVAQQKTGLNSSVAVELMAAIVTFKGINYFQIIVVNKPPHKSEQQKAEAEKEQYQAYIEQSSEGIFRYELKEPIPANKSVEEITALFKQYAVLTECNDAMARMYGYDNKEELLKAQPAQLVDFSDAANRAYITAFIENGFKIIDAQSEEQDKYGATRYFCNNLTGILEDGYLVRVWGTQTDITKRKKDEEKIRLLANLVEETADVLMAADLDFKPTTWNKAAEKIYGLTAEQVLGKNLRSLIDITYKNATREEVRNAISTTGAWRGEMCFTRPADKKLVTLLASFKVLKQENGTPIGYVIAGTDITERIEAEQKLLESEHRFQLVANAAPIGIWMNNAEGEMTFVSKSLLEFSGLQHTNYSTVKWKNLVHEDDYEKASRLFKKSVSERLPVTLVYRLKRENGYSWVQDSGTPRFLADGQFMGYTGSVINIDAIKLNEEKLRYQATILENVLDVLVTTDLNFNVKTWNKIAEKIYGFTEAEAVNRPLKELVAFEYVDTTLEAAKAALELNNVWKGEVIFRDKYGQNKYFVQTVTWLYDGAGNRTGAMAVGREITERIAAETKLKQSESFYRSLIADSLDGILLLDEEGCITFVSLSVKKILGYEIEEVTGKNAFNFVHPQDHEWALQSFKKEVAKTTEIKFMVARLLCKNGTWLWCSLRGNNLLNNPYVNSVAIYFHDDTLRKKASDALKASEQYFKQLVTDLQTGVILLNAAGKTVLANKEICNMLAVSEERLQTMPFWLFFTDAVKENGRQYKVEDRPVYRAVHTKQKVHGAVVGLQLPSTNQRLWLMVNADPVCDAQGNLLNVICSFTNITERKKLEQKLLTEEINRQKSLTQATIDGQEKERREIGKELHDNIGQQLTTTKLYLDLTRSMAYENADEMVSLAIKSISDVINEIRGISRSLVPQTLNDLGLIDSIYDLTETINRTTALPVLLDDTHFIEEKTSENQKLMLFRIIQEGLNNIVKHAAATNVTITLNNVSSSLVLQIIDDGKGFDLSKTRKTLGLTNIKNRAELFGGRVEILSALGDGCTLTITIPQAVPSLS